MSNFDFSLSISAGDVVNLVTLLLFIADRRNKGLTPKQYHILLEQIVELKRPKGGL